MNQTLRLHYAPDNASLCVRLALEETGFGYETVLVDRRIKEQKSALYTALNPHGLIPTLETAHGPIFETAAILLWISEQTAGTPLMPPPGHHERGRALSWLFWLSNSLHPALRFIFYPEQHTNGDGTATLVQTTKVRTTSMLDKLEGLAQSHPDWLHPEKASLHTCYLTPILRWLALYPLDGTDWFALDRWPALNTLATGIETRPASRRAATAEGLGPTPFSSPRLPQPPEGSAL